jgi:hypothetical protein
MSCSFYEIISRTICNQQSIQCFPSSTIGSAVYITSIQEWAINFQSCVLKSDMNEFLKFNLLISFAFIEYIEAFDKNPN